MVNTKQTIIFSSLVPLCEYYTYYPVFLLYFILKCVSFLLKKIEIDSPQQSFLLLRYHTMPSLCKCGKIREQFTSGPNSNFPGRPFFNCQSCGQFDWADERGRVLFDSQAGPECRCGNSTVRRTVKKDGPNKGRKFWGCASWPRGCKFFEFFEGGEEEEDRHHQQPQALPQTPTMTPERPEKKRPALTGWASWLSDWKKMEIIQKMMTVDPKKMAHAAKHRSSFSYDKLDVVGLWNISNPARMERYEAAKHRVKAENPIVSSYEFTEPYSDAMNQLGIDSLDTKAGEVFLLHGTDPEKLHSILFEGLDPGISRNGNFGRGVYFAENAAKIDQYAKEDARFQKNGPLSELHKKIYGNSHHPQNVRYALVCRVLLRRHVQTEDGVTKLCEKKSDGDQKVHKAKPLFTDNNRRTLATFDDGTTPSSLVAVPGRRVRTFREFVVFNSDQIFVEYLVAYKRIQSMCDCGIPCMERSVTKTNDNYGRKIHLCGGKEKGSSKTCDFIQMFPLCNCGQSASVKTSHTAKNPNRKFYSCHNNRSRGRSCNFFEWKDRGYFSSPYKKPRTLNYS